MVDGDAQHAIGGFDHEITHEHFFLGWPFARGGGMPQIASILSASPGRRATTSAVNGR
jgi:hypothetical protein